MTQPISLATILVLLLLSLEARAITPVKPTPTPAASPAQTILPAEARTETVTVEVPDEGYLFSTIEPFVPRDTDYSIEIGAMAENRSLYWIAGNIGQHIGRCLLTTSQTCQQYIDGIIGVGGRDEETFGIFLGSLRWQFINFPRSWSPMLRLFGGVTRAHVREAKEWRPMYGAGIGVTTYLHERADLRFELRGGQMGDHAFAQGLIGIQFKADRLLEYFAVKLVELGITTAETAIKATEKAVEATGNVLKGAAGKNRDAQDETTKKPAK